MRVSEISKKKSQLHVLPDNLAFLNMISDMTAAYRIWLPDTGIAGRIPDITAGYRICLTDTGHDTWLQDIRPGKEFTCTYLFILILSYTKARSIFGTGTSIRFFEVPDIWLLGYPANQNMMHLIKFLKNPVGPILKNHTDPTGSECATHLPV